MSGEEQNGGNTDVPAGTDPEPASPNGGEQADPNTNTAGGGGAAAPPDAESHNNSAAPATEGGGAAAPPDAESHNNSAAPATEGGGGGGNAVPNGAANSAASSPLIRKVKRAPASPDHSKQLHALSQSMGSIHSEREPPNCAVLSNFKSGPQVTMGGRVASGSFFRSSSTPGPGTYNNHSASGDSHSKYTMKPRYSFGGASRFGLGQNPSKERPGPGHYGAPRDPGMERGPRVGFGGGERSNLAKAGEAPGPGAYELKTCLGEGKMFTAGGRHYGSTVRSRMMPGPGAYDPTDRIDGKFCAPPKVGFGTATREDFSVKREAGKPGPGTYEMTQKKAIGSDAAKFSIRSRRRLNDLNSYIEPGPGHYASHATSFMRKTF